MLHVRCFRDVDCGTRILDDARDRLTAQGLVVDQRVGDRLEGSPVGAEHQPCSSPEPSRRTVRSLT